MGLLRRQRRKCVKDAVRHDARVVSQTTAIAAGMLVLLCVQSTSARAADTDTATNAPIKVGIVAPMSGPNSRYGDFAWRGAEMAADEINSAGGIHGHKIELLQGDSQCVPAEGVSATQRLVEYDKVTAIIGDVCSSVTLAMQPIVEKAHVILLNAASSNPEITRRAGVGGFRWTFRNYPTDESRAMIALQYAAQVRGYTKLAALGVDSDYGRGAIGYTKKYLARFHATFLNEDYYKETETDFRPFLSRAKYEGAQAIVLYGLADSTPIIARQMRELGMQGKVKLVGNAEFSAAQTIASAPSVLEGAIEASAWLPEWPDPRSVAFVSKFKSLYHGEVPSIQAYSPWETLHLLADAMQQSASLDPSAIRNAVANIDYHGAMGEVRFDDHNQGELPMILTEIEHGKPVIKGSFRSDIDYGTPLKK